MAPLTPLPPFMLLEEKLKLIERQSVALRWQAAITTLGVVLLLVVWTAFGRLDNPGAAATPQITPSPIDHPRR